ncbi:hypothetical protein FVC19_22820, partial [Salmonella enterica]|nr:hypothetical protein [Salmonella enterica]EDN2010117.1 hypothetical protein [Salmonella enterica]EEL8428176.1 hypothetical protein [Salmonella enterica]
DLSLERVNAIQDGSLLRVVTLPRSLNPPSSGFFINTSIKVIKNVDIVSINVYYNSMFNRMEEW